MSVKTATAAELSELSKSSGSAARYFIFWASGTPSWCPDCRQSLPAVEKVFGPGGAAEGYMVYAGERPDWRDAKNFARVQYNVQCVPTIVAFKQGKEVGRIEDVPACAQEGLIRKFIKDTA